MDHPEVSIGMPNVDSGMQIPLELAAHVTPTKIAENFSNYPEMQQILSPEQQRRVGLIKGTLSQIPLIHGTGHDLDGLDILPIGDLPEGHRGRTHGLDRSLGLHKYTFFNWGLPEKTSGSTIMLVNPEILNSPNTLVTGFDIGEIRMVDDTPYDDVKDDVKESYQREYFDKVVTGTQWVEIVARRVLADVEAGKPFYSLWSKGALGEIKHLGKVDKGAILGKITADDFKSYYKFLYEHGFSFSNIEHYRELEKRTGVWQGVDPTPEECGIDYDDAAKYWQRLFAQESLS